METSLITEEALISSALEDRYCPSCMQWYYC